MTGITVVCPTSGCENEGAPIVVDPWDGSAIICGPCGAVLEVEADWFVPPDDPVDPVESAAQALARLTPEERAALIALLAEPDEEETP